MKKQIKKLSLNKKTISNLTTAEMNRQFGGSFYTEARCIPPTRYTCHGKTCNHNCTF